MEQLHCNYLTTSSHQLDIHQTNQVSYFQKGRCISRPDLLHQRYIKTLCHDKKKKNGVLSQRSCWNIDYSNVLLVQGGATC